MAIMGSSGAGKSTLMNILTRRNIQGLKIDGEITVNGVRVKEDISKILAQKSYVTFSFRLIVTLEITCDSSQWLCVNFCVVISVAVRTRPLMEKHTL